MNFQDIFSSIASDNILLTSTADFFQSKIENAISLIDKLSDIASHAGEEGYVLPVITESIGLNIDGDAVVLDPDEIADAIYNDVEELEVVQHGKTYAVKVEEVIDQISDSVMSNRCMIEAIRTLKDAAGDSISSLSTLFLSRLQTQVGEISETAANLGMQFLDILTQRGKGVGDRIRDCLNFIGLYTAESADPVDIGFPDSDLSEFTGANVYTAWFAGAPKTILELKDWIVSTVKKVIELFKGLLQVVLGSALYRNVKKIFSTLTLQADSFAYNSGDEEGYDLGSHGYWAKFTLNDYTQSWLQYDLSTISGCISAIVSSSLNLTPSSNISTNLDTILSVILGSVTPADGSPLKVLMDSLSNVSVSTPNWLAQILTGDNTIMNKVGMIYYSFVGRYYKSLSPTYLTCFDMISAVLGAILDANHVNDDQGIADHLQSNSYFKVDLPCSSLYIWLVGSEVVVTRRVTPISMFFDATPNLYDNTGGRLSLYHLIGMAPGGQGQRISLHSLASLFAQLRTCGDNYVEYDNQMRNAIWWSTAIDSVFMYFYQYLRSHGHSFTEELNSYIEVPLGLGSILNQGFLALTGISHDSWMSQFGSLSSGDISNKTLASMVGCYVSGSRISQVSFMVSFLRQMFIDINDGNVFLPFAHVGNIAYGRYHIISDSELGDVFSAIIKLAIVIVATIFVMKKISSVKKKAMATRTKADAVAWDQVTKGTYDPAAITAQYKLYRRANLLDKLSSGLFTATSSVVRTIGSKVTTAASSFTAAIKNTLSGNGTYQQEPLDLTAIAKLIRGS